MAKSYTVDRYEIVKYRESFRDNSEKLGILYFNE